MAAEKVQTLPQTMTSNYSAHLCFRVVGPEAECHVLAVVHRPRRGYVGLVCLCVDEGQPSTARVEVCTPYHLHSTSENLGDGGRVGGGVRWVVEDGRGGDTCVCWGEGGGGGGWVV